MTQEYKELLLKYLCMALPYGVKVKFAFNKDIEKNNNLIYVLDNKQSYIHNSCMVLTGDNINLDECKPYLRPMSSMTEDEKEELNCLCYHNIGVQDNMLQGYLCGCEIIDVIDWLLEHHFDFMGLIPKDLAIEITKDNNPYEN